jgi:hypothetical protein
VEAFVGSLASTAATDSSSSSSTTATTGSSSSRSNAVLRGPALAQVEVAKRKLQLGVGDEQQLVQALLEYHGRWGPIAPVALAYRDPHTCSPITHLEPMGLQGTGWSSPAAAACRGPVHSHQGLFRLERSALMRGCVHCEQASSTMQCMPAASSCV